MTEKINTTEFNSLTAEAINGLLTSISEEDLSSVFDAILEKYPTKYTKEYTDKLIKALKRLYGEEIDPVKILREFKNLINDCVYNRLSKKHKNELINKNGFDEKRVEILFEAINRINLGNELVQFDENGVITNFDVQTVNPISSSSNSLVVEGNEYSSKEDFRQQNILINLEIEDSKEVKVKEIKEEDKKDGKNTNTKTLKMKLEKKNLVNFFTELEKLQEKLDELY